MRFELVEVSTPSGTPYHENPREELVSILQRVGARGTVLDIGCGAGAFGQRLLDQGVADAVFGVEIDEAVAATAAQRLTDVVVGDLSQPEVLDGLPVADVAVAADVLEHLVDPGAVLRALADKVRQGGHWMVSVPNVRHHSVLRDLILRDEWRYVQEGICDQTHLRFFTRTSLERLCRDAGLAPSAGFLLAAGRSGRAARILPALGGFVAVQIVIVGQR